MIRVFVRSLLIAVAIVAVDVSWRADAALAQKVKTAATGAAAKTQAAAKPDPAKSGGDTTADASKGKSVQIATSGDWRGFLAQSGKSKTCYALASPNDREPAALKREPAYLFISNRPSENVHNEISIMLGFAVKDGGDAHAEVAGSNFDLVAKGTNAWIKNPADEGHFIDALKKGGKLLVKAPSVKGKTTTDSYTLAGLKPVLDKVQKECP